MFQGFGLFRPPNGFLQQSFWYIGFVLPITTDVSENKLKMQSQHSIQNACSATIWPIFLCFRPLQLQKAWNRILTPEWILVISTLNIWHLCPYDAKLAVSWPPEGLLGFCKGQNPSKFVGPTRAGPIKENLCCCYYVRLVRIGVGAYGYLGGNPKFLNETAAWAAAACIYRPGLASC